MFSMIIFQGFMNIRTVGASSLKCNFIYIEYSDENIIISKEQIFTLITHSLSEISYFHASYGYYNFQFREIAFSKENHRL